MARVLKVYIVENQVEKKLGSFFRKYFIPMFALAKMMFHIVVRCGNYARFAEIKLSICVQLNPRLGLILFFIPDIKFAAIVISSTYHGILHIKIQIASYY